MRKLTNNFKKQDTATKIGLTIVTSIIIPMLITVVVNIDPTNLF